MSKPSGKMSSGEAPVGTGPCLNADFNHNEFEEGDLITFIFVLFYLIIVTFIA